MSDIKNFNHLENIDYTEFGERTVRMRVFTKKFIVDLFLQVLVNLQMLQSKFSFNHGNLTVDKMLISDQPTDINFNIIRYKSDLSFKIYDFRYSSMNINTPKNGLVRIFNSNKYAEKYFGLLPFKPVIDQSFNQAYYSIDHILDIQILAKIRHLGIPFYSSFDTITFILSVLTVPQIFYSIISDPSLKAGIWDVLWHPKDESDIFRELNRVNQELSDVDYSKVINLLKGKWIKCDITDLLIESIVNNCLDE